MRWLQHRFQAEEHLFVARVATGYTLIRRIDFESAHGMPIGRTAALQGYGTSWMYSIRIACLCVLIALSGCRERQVAHEAILGKWRSNAPLTLKSVDRVEGITPQTRAFLHDDFFGHMEVEITEDESRTTHEKDDYDSGFEPYEVLEVSDDFVRIKIWSNFFQGYDVRTLYLDGDCYYEIFREFEFRQYFCRDGS